ncbi:hypothetical protein [Paraburkholderia sp. SIMBA_030]|uniref:hypothetical protein n=1 Tax=Paraburkholderia sp. SIMBA_030 TaxID=3085773 RepID=UPI00397C38E1
MASARTGKGGSDAQAAQNGAVVVDSGGGAQMRDGVPVAMQSEAPASAFVPIVAAAAAPSVPSTPIAFALHVRLPNGVGLDLLSKGQSVPREGRHWVDNFHICAGSLPTGRLPPYGESRVVATPISLVNRIPGLSRVVADPRLDEALQVSAQTDQIVDASPDRDGSSIILNHLVEHGGKPVVNCRLEITRRGTRR